MRSQAVPDNSSRSTTPVSGALSETDDSVYNRLNKLAYDTITMMCKSITGPYQYQRAAMLIFTVANICHEIAKTAGRPSWLTAMLFHGSGIIATEALVWVIFGQLLWLIIFNVTVLLVALVCYYRDICELLNISYRKIFGRKSLHAADQMDVRDYVSKKELKVYKRKKVRGILDQSKRERIVQPNNTAESAGEGVGVLPR